MRNAKIILWPTSRALLLGLLFVMPCLGAESSGGTEASPISVIEKKHDLIMSQLSKSSNLFAYGGEWNPFSALFRIPDPLVYGPAKEVTVTVSELERGWESVRHDRDNDPESVLAYRSMLLSARESESQSISYLKFPRSSNPEAKKYPLFIKFYDLQALALGLKVVQSFIDNSDNHFVEFYDWVQEKVDETMENQQENLSPARQREQREKLEKEFRKKHRAKYDNLVLEELKKANAKLASSRYWLFNGNHLKVDQVVPTLIKTFTRIQKAESDPQSKDLPISHAFQNYARGYNIGDAIADLKEVNKKILKPILEEVEKLTSQKSACNSSIEN